MAFRLLPLLLSVFSFAFGGSGAQAQIDLLNPVPGGATGDTVHCLQAGDLNSGLFVSTYLLQDDGSWVETPKSPPGAQQNTFSETSRTTEVVELFDAARNLSIQFEFGRKKVRFSSANDWQDFQHMLNATDKDGSKDCAFLARQSAGISAAPGGTGGNAGGGGGAPNGTMFVPVPGPGYTPSQSVTIKIGAPLVIKPNTKLTATNGPACPGVPGYFLCPNKFDCAPVGGVCCPGTGACGPGAHCDLWGAGFCLAPGNPRFCPGTANPATGVALHCPPGMACVAGNFCR